MSESTIENRQKLAFAIVSGLSHEQLQNQLQERLEQDYHHNDSVFEFDWNDEFGPEED